MACIGIVHPAFRRQCGGDKRNNVSKRNLLVSEEHLDSSSQLLTQASDILT
jgi:hypothetical protein